MNKMYDLYWENIGWKIKYLFVSIKNLIRWTPIIFHDRDWDDYFIFEVLKFKLSNQAKHIRKNSFHLNSEREAQIIETCIRLIKKLQNEYYILEWADYQNSEFISTPSETYPDSYEIDIITISENFEDYFKKYPNVYNKVLKLEYTKFKRTEAKGIALNIADYNHNRAKRILFTLLERNIEKWWN